MPGFLLKQSPRRRPRLKRFKKHSCKATSLSYSMRRPPAVSQIQAVGIPSSNCYLILKKSYPKAVQKLGESPLYIRTPFQALS